MKGLSVLSTTFTGQGFLLVFSITSFSSIIELQELRDQIVRIKAVQAIHEKGWMHRDITPSSILYFHTDHYASVTNATSSKSAQYNALESFRSHSHGTMRSIKIASLERAAT